MWENYNKVENLVRINDIWKILHMLYSVNSGSFVGRFSHSTTNSFNIDYFYLKIDMLFDYANDN